jgi:MerR family regulatory protein.
MFVFKNIDHNLGGWLMIGTEVENVLISEVCRMTGLTRKAVEYYIEKGLISPLLLDNGYRSFDEKDIEQLEKVSVLRKLGMGTDEIKTVLADPTGNVLRTLAVKKELDIQREQAKKSFLEKLCSGTSYSEIRGELMALENGRTIAEKLLDAFPGYYGRLICLHFAHFLHDPITTQKQKKAYERIISFLDNLPSPDIPEDLKAYLESLDDGMEPGNISDMLENTRNSLENIEEFIKENSDFLRQYLEYRKSDEYRNSPAFRLMAFLKDFSRASGYYDVFIPAMKELSPSYAEYCRKMEAAGEKLLAEYPDIENLE